MSVNASVPVGTGGVADVAIAFSVTDSGSVCGAVSVNWSVQYEPRYWSSEVSVCGGRVLYASLLTRHVSLDPPQATRGYPAAGCLNKRGGSR